MASNDKNNLWQAGGAGFSSKTDDWATPPEVFAALDASDLAIAVRDSENKKLGQAATTYAAQSSCPTSCPFFNGGGCYAESGPVSITTARLNAAAKALPSGPFEVAAAEAVAIDALKVVPGRPLRLHTVGDCATDEATRIVAAAADRYRHRGGGPVWTYTHAWREVSRESWDDVSVLASCETAEDVPLAGARGYATAVVVDEFTNQARHLLDGRAGEAAGLDVLPCPQQTRGRTCSECTLCFDDKKLAARGYSIAFAVHGAPATVRKARKALHSPDDPERRLSTRVLIPRVIAELEAAGKPVTNAAIARRLECNASSVAQMRGKLAREAAEAVPQPPAGDASPTSFARGETHKLGGETPCPDATPQLRGVMASQTTSQHSPANARRPHPVVGRRAARPIASEVAREAGK